MDAHLLVVVVLVCFVVNFGNLRAELRVERSVELLEYDIPENYTFIDIGLEIHNQLQVFGIYNVVMDRVRTTANFENFKKTTRF